MADPTASLTREASCCLAYTAEEFHKIRAGLAPTGITEPYSIREEGRNLEFLNRADESVEFIARFEARGGWHLLTGILLSNDSSSFDAFPRDLDVAAFLWIIIERDLLGRFQGAEWQDFSENFRTTPTNDDPAVPMTAHDRNFLIARGIYCSERARTCQKAGLDGE